MTRDQPTRSARRPRSVRLHQIREAAWLAFATKPYESVGLSEIADEIGLARSTIHSYVDSKDDLYRYCLERALSEMEAHLGEIRSDLPRSERLRAVVAVLLCLDEANEPAWGLVQRHIFAGTGPFAREGLRMRQQLLRTIGQPIVDSPDLGRVEAAAAAVLGALQAVAAYRQIRSDQPVEEVIEQVSATFWHGLRAL